MSDTVFCPHCAATTGAQIPLPVTITPIRGGVHVESYRACPECGRTVCYDQTEEEAPRPTEVVGYEVEYAYSDGDCGYSDTRTFGRDEYDEAKAYADRLNGSPDTTAYLRPIEREVRTAAERAEEAGHLCAVAEGSPTPGIFKIDLEMLSRAVYDLKLQLGADGHDLLVAEADEVLTTLRIVQDQDDLRTARVGEDLARIARRLAG